MTSSTRNNNAGLFLILCSPWLLSLDVLLLPAVDAFAVVHQQYSLSQTRSPSPSALLMAKRQQKKESMAAKRQRRAQGAAKRKQALDESTASLPKSKLEFKTPPPPPTPTVPAAATSATQDQVNSKAKQLIAAQMKSVKMLTHVTDRMDALMDNMSAVMHDLNSKGFYVVDDFLEEESYVQQLIDESTALYNNGDMTADLATLGTGEFVAALQGGADQYPKCPRSIEWVVSVTSKLAAKLNSYQGDGDDELTMGELDDRACASATSRIFDRSAFQASLQLLLGEGQDTVTIEDSLNNSDTTPPFQTVIEKDPADNRDDLRKISLCYFLVPSEWDASCGGHLSFQGNSDGDAGTTTTIHAKRNRLVLWKSDTAAYRREPFQGSDDMAMAGTMELHLVQKQQQMRPKR